MTYIHMLRELISRDMKRLAGKVYHARGTAYFEQGLVKLIDENDIDIIACVAGTYDYEVRLWQEDDELMYECSCPVGKMAISASIALQPVLRCSQSAWGKKQHSAMDDIRNYLETLEVDALMGIIRTPANMTSACAKGSCW
ncbi:hypothetical protein [Nitrosospira sp. NRS527]|uniref:SWIM zinc finger family protein n=1 Tax=Nitrosospira sp. NRS527 TaxID=155925 RepID=UPI001AF94C36|nr:hypothetical protein [Nitrosospira sp. NRS527]BCT68279.1 hypothetical protein NNRS527_01875 [Nitrosospira sp. NRS527]